MEEKIKIVAKMYKCRDTVKFLTKMQNEDYKQTLKPYTEIIESVMQAEKLEHIPALLVISKTKTYQDSGMNQLLFMTALVELMEPSI